MKKTYLTTVLLRMAKLLVPLSLIFSIGFHWLILQSIAWTGMLAQYSATDTWTVALQKTFDGKNACRLCKFVKEGKAQEKKDKAISVEIKIDHWVVDGSVQFHPLDRWTAAHFPDFLHSLTTRADAPLLPPPRLS